MSDDTTGVGRMSLRHFCDVLVDRVEKAGEAGNKREAARLLRIMAEACDEEARKLERHQS